MPENNNSEIERIKELESINLAREEIRDLVIDTKKEVERDNDLLAEQINKELVNKGIGRQEGHELLRQAAIKARNENLYIKDILIENEEVKTNFSQEELEDLLDPHKYIGKAIEQVDNLIKDLKSKYKL